MAFCLSVGIFGGEFFVAVFVGFLSSSPFFVNIGVFFVKTVVICSSGLL